MAKIQEIEVLSFLAKEDKDGFMERVDAMDLEERVHALGLLTKAKKFIASVYPDPKEFKDRMLKPHKHSCESCKVTWSHRTAYVEDEDFAHDCPKCGKEQAHIDKSKKKVHAKYKAWGEANGKEKDQ